jgi:hypothetical protein
MRASRSVNGPARRPRHGRTRAIGIADVGRRERREPPITGETVGGRADCCFAQRGSLGAVIVLPGAVF